jgi:Flp pilus assembly protein TadD
VHNNLAVVCMLTGRYDDAEKEIQLAEKNGFRVNQGLKDDVKARKAGSRKSRSKDRSEGENALRQQVLTSGQCAAADGY